MGAKPATGGPEIQEEPRVQSGGGLGDGEALALLAAGQPRVDFGCPPALAATPHDQTQIQPIRQALKGLEISGLQLSVEELDQQQRSVAVHRQPGASVRHAVEDPPAIRAFRLESVLQDRSSPDGPLQEGLKGAQPPTRAERSASVKGRKLPWGRSPNSKEPKRGRCSRTTWLPKASKVLLT